MNDNLNLRKAGVILAYPLAYLYMRLVLTGTEYVFVGNTIFTLAFIGFNELMLRGRGKKVPTREKYFWYAILILTAVTSSAAPALPVTMLGLHLAAVYSVLVSNGILFEGKTGSFIVNDLLNAMVMKTFPNFELFPKDIKEVSSAEDGSGRKGQLRFYIAGAGLILLMIPVFSVAVFLLGNINSEFGKAAADLMDKIDVFKYLSGRVGEIIFRLIFAVPVCFYLYSLTASCAREDGSREHELCERRKSKRIARRRIPSGFTSFLSGSFVVLYVIFFVFEGEHIFGGLFGRLPSGFNIADYAREGFFELVWIMVINMIICLIVVLTGKREGIGWRINRAVLAALMGESVLFSVLSFTKLMMYFAEYGYTVKRMLAMWGSLVLGAGAVMVIITLMRSKDMSGLWIRFTAMTYVLMCIISGVCGIIY